MGSERPVLELPQGVLSLGGATDGRHGPQNSMRWDMVVTTHWGGAGNGGTIGDWGIYLPPTEHGHTIHCGSSYHELVSVIRAETGNSPIQAMVGAARSRYPE